ncbi:MAG: hypothetical protein CMH57_11950 [Myxococcales bacterium]|nr:hypothetical protein [Myxococcales bacterium]
MLRQLPLPLFITALGLLLTTQTWGQDDAVTRNQVEIIRPDQLPGPTRVADHERHIDQMRASVFPVRVTLDLHRPHYASVTDTPAQGAAVLIALPGQRDEPGLLVTATQLLQRARTVEIRHPDGSWHPARILLNDPALGLAVLDAPTPASARAVPLADHARKPYALTNPTIAPDQTISFLPARLGAPGEEALAFYRHLETRTAPIGAPILDERGELRAIVGLVIYDGDHKGHWALDHGVVATLIKRMANPQEGSERVRRETLEFTNPMRPFEAP